MFASLSNILLISCIYSASIGTCSNHANTCKYAVRRDKFIISAKTGNMHLCARTGDQTSLESGCGSWQGQKRGQILLIKTFRDRYNGLGSVAEVVVCEHSASKLHDIGLGLMTGSHKSITLHSLLSPCIQWGNTGLHEAAHGDHLQIVTLLLNHKATCGLKNNVMCGRLCWSGECGLRENMMVWAGGCMN